MVWPFTAGLQNPSAPTHVDDGDQDTSKPETERVFLGVSSTEVFGYPSDSQEVLVLPYCSGVDLDFLGLDRFGSAERDGDAEAEDRLCERMRMLGAWHFLSVHEYRMMQFLDATEDGLSKRRLVVAAWPEEGGAWVLAKTVREAGKVGFAVFQNVFSMKEKVDAVRKLGGTFYQEPEDCPDLRLGRGHESREEL